MTDQANNQCPQGESKRGGTDKAYEARLAAESGTYRNCVNVHDLPDIFHYWSNRHVRPKLEALGFSAPNDMFQKSIGEHCGLRKNDTPRFVSIGSGNCDLEISLALHLRSIGQTGFIIDCLDMNSAMLDRGQMAAEKNGLSRQLNFAPIDLNEWTPTHEYDAVIANQILHHVVKLEDLFTSIKNCLKPEGSLIVSDMIGRNGHQRWPEALEIVRRFWRKLPPSYRFNQGLQRYEELFEDWDCSGEGFEGIRSQDILPLLLEHFHFRLFFGFANVIDPFVDRAFGHSFDANASWDRNFIDEVNHCDEEEMRSGYIKPTHMLAVLGNHPVTSMIFQEPFTPQFCLRKTSPASVGVPVPGSLNDPLNAYEWHSWPHSPKRELEIACIRLKRCQEDVKEQTAWALRLEKELEERTTWALQLEKLVEERTVWALQLEKELEGTATRALHLNNELERLNAQVEERTSWALRLQQEAEDGKAQLSQLRRQMERLAWARPLDRRLHNFMHALYRIVRWARNQMNRILARKECRRSE